MPHPPADWSRTLASSTTAPSTATEDGHLEGVSPPRRRRARLAALAAILLAAAGAAIVALQSGSSPRTSAGPGLPPGDTTTTVERRTLVERSQLDGTLTYSGSGEIYDRLSGTFTWLPSVGSTVRRGGTLFRVNDLPVVLMYGSLPMYRALKEGLSDGSDVAELNANLIALGYDPYGGIGDQRHFGSATAAAVRRWQHAEGLSQTGEVELGRVVFAHSARRITAVHVALGDDPPGSSNGEEATKPKDGSQPKEGKEKEGSHGKEHAGSKEKERPKERRKESSKESSEKEAAKEGDSGGAAPKAVLGTTSTQQQVQLQVKADQQQLARVGEAAPVTLPDGRVVHARVTDVGTVASESSEKEGANGGNGGNGGGGGNGNGSESGNGENATIPVTLALDHSVARLDKAPVSVELVKSIRRNVLAVPATALVATAGGGYAIQALVNGRLAELPVTPGMFANGYVEIEGTDVHPGLTVAEPQ